MYKVLWQEVAFDNIRDLVIKINYRYFIATLQELTQGGPDVGGSFLLMVHSVSDLKQTGLLPVWSGP